MVGTWFWLRVWEFFFKISLYLFKIDVQDDRFAAMYSSHLYNLDPANPQFRKTEATNDLLKEKVRRHTDHSVS